MRTHTLPTLESRLGEAFARYLVDASRGDIVKFARSAAKAQTQEIGRFYEVQGLLRPIFGKEGMRPPDIGDHPDFGHIKGTDELIYCPITTLFMDIESSTRMGLLYAPHDVYKIKNAFIRAAIELITSFDGHVHRIMGDAVMAFFGGLHGQPEHAAIDALNCAAVLRVFVESTVVPRLKAAGFADPFGIRIGLDHGPRDKVLWSSYGYPQSDEVTATSFYVDVASKLQHSAGRNQIMIGHSLKEFLDFPDVLLATKKVQRDGRELEEPFIRPNHTDRDGNPTNYGQYLLMWDEYLAYTPLGQGDKRLLPRDPANGAVDPIPVTVAVHASQDGPREQCYHPCGSMIPKGRSLKFTLQRSLLPPTSYTVTFAVENHGREASEQGGETLGNHSEKITVNSQANHQRLCRWESTAYRGLHFMTIEVHTSGRLHSRTRIGIYVE